MIKKIDRLILQSFIGPFVATFCIALFVLVMQFFYLYIDDLVGKGLEIRLIIKLIFYTCAALVPMALPLAVLLSSIITFGNLGEHYELVALKSSGISLLRIMRSLALTSVVLAGLAFCFSNYLLPKANLKKNTLMYDIIHKQPAFDVQEDVFYNGIEGYSIKADKKSEDGKTLYDVIIYDHTKGRGNSNVTIAEKAVMFPDAQGKYLTFLLSNGEQYEEYQAKAKPRKEDEFEHVRTKFKEYHKVFDMSGFDMKNTDEDLFKKHYQMLNIRQLQVAVDSINNEIDNRSVILERHLKKYIGLENDSFRDEMKLTNAPKNIELSENFLSEANIESSLFSKMPVNLKTEIVKSALSHIKNSKAYVNVARQEIVSKGRAKNKYDMEWHRKFALSFGCIVLFFVGAPLGAITKKGGLGSPMILSIVFFVLYYLLNTFGKKLSEEFILNPFLGMWLATFVLISIGIFLSYKALNDKNIINIDVNTDWLKKHFNGRLDHQD